MRTKYLIPVLPFLLSTILLSACDVIGVSASTSLGAITPIDTSASTLMVTIGITEDQDATDGRSNITFQFRTAVVEEDNFVAPLWRKKEAMNREKKENPMAKYAFWTRRRFTGITLIVGCFLFLGAA